MFARPVSNSIRPPSRTRQQHIDSYLKHPNLGPSTRKVSAADDSTFDTVFQSVEGDTLILRVHWPPSSFDSVQPFMTLAGVEARHDWLDSRMRVSGYQPLQSLEAWKAANQLLGEAVLQVVQHLQIHSPSILRFTDAGLIAIQKKQPQQQPQAGNPNTAPPPPYADGSYSHRQQPSRGAPGPPPPPPPPPVTLPPVPGTFPELDSCTLEQVRKIANDHIDLQAFCAKLKYMQDLKTIQTKTLDENFAVASDRSRTCEAQLTGLSSAVTTLEEELKRKVQAYSALDREQQEILKPTPIRDVRRKLVAGKKQAFDESEAIADKWTGDNTDAFLTEFLQARKIHHLRAAKLELLDHSPTSSDRL